MIIKKWLIIITCGIFCLIAISLSILWYYGGKNDQRIAKECIQHDRNSLFMINCYGVVSINRSFDIQGYSMTDYLHGNYTLAEIDSLNDYKFQDGKIFVKNRAALNCSVTDKYGKKQFCQNLFQDGQMNDNYYDKESDIPLYLIVDTQTGNIEAYKTISEVPENQQNIFQELEQSLP